MTSCSSIVAKSSFEFVLAKLLDGKGHHTVPSEDRQTEKIEIWNKKVYGTNGELQRTHFDLHEGKTNNK